MTKEHLGYLITRTSGQVVSESLLPVFPPPTSSLPHSSSHSSTPPPALCVCVSDVRSEVKSTEALMGHEDPLTRQCRGRWFRRYYEGKPELPHKFTILDGHVIGGKLFLSTGMAHLTMG